MPHTGRVGTGVMAAGSLPVGKRKAVPSPPRGSIPRRSIGTIRPYAGVTLSSHRDCALCRGTHVRGMWIHDEACLNRVMLWFAHGYHAEDWGCFYGCPGQRLPSGVTHAWNCPFWNTTEAVPFGQKEPAPF